MSQKKVFSKSNTPFWQRSITILICALISCGLWGSAFPFIKLGYKYMELAPSDTASIILYAGIRFTLAGILAIIFGSIQQKKILIPSKSAVPKVFVLCMFQTFLQYVFFYIGLANSSGVNASIINGMSTPLSILVACFIFRSEKMNIKKILGCLIGFAGIVIVALSGGSIGAIRITGEGFVFMTSLSYAFSAGFLKKYSQTENTVMLSGWQFVFGGVLMMIVGIFLGGKPGVINTPSVSILLWLAFVSAAAYTLWGTLLKHNPVSKVAVFGFMNPVFGVILSAILLHEGSNVGLLSIAALALVSLGIYICNKK